MEKIKNHLQQIQVIYGETHHEVWTWLFWLLSPYYSPDFRCNNPQKDAKVLLYRTINRSWGYDISHFQGIFHGKPSLSCTGWGYSSEYAASNIHEWVLMSYYHMIFTGHIIFNIM